MSFLASSSSSNDWLTRYYYTRVCKITRKAIGALGIGIDSINEGKDSVHFSLSLFPSLAIFSSLKWPHRIECTFVVSFLRFLIYSFIVVLLLLSYYYFEIFFTYFTGWADTFPERKIDQDEDCQNAQCQRPLDGSHVVQSIGKVFLQHVATFFCRGGNCIDNEWKLEWHTHKAVSRKKERNNSLKVFLSRTDE